VQARVKGMQGNGVRRSAIGWMPTTIDTLVMILQAAP
jgi:hypothetical protein